MELLVPAAQREHRAAMPGYESAVLVVLAVLVVSVAMGRLGVRL